MAYTERLSSTQQYTVLSADERGLLTGRPVTLQSLVTRGIATGAPYRLTESGTALREQLGCPVKDFPADYGNLAAEEGRRTVVEAAWEARRNVVEAAWEAMRAHRAAHRGSANRAAVWERMQPMRAAAVILEAWNARSSATDEYGRRARPGYSLASSSPYVRIQHHLLPQWTQPGHPDRREESEVHAAHTAAYNEYNHIFTAAGWKATLMRPTITHSMYMIALPVTSARTKKD